MDARHEAQVSVSKWATILALLPLCWLLMMAAHEAGHVVAAWLTGGVVSRVVLHPFTISRTELSHNPHPLAVAWAGPLVGVAAPLVLYLGCQALRRPGAHLMRFFAGFCLIANGAYVGAGVFGQIGDAGELLRQGCPRWTLWASGLAAVSFGLLLWHRLGRDFGLGPEGRVIRPREALAVWTLLIAVFALLLVVG